MVLCVICSCFLYEFIGSVSVFGLFRFVWLVFSVGSVMLLLLINWMFVVCGFSVCFFVFLFWLVIVCSVGCSMLNSSVSIIIVLSSMWLVLCIYGSFY